MRILYIDIDSLRPDHLGCYGYHRNTSPCIDKIASEGIRFSNVYASDVPCCPSRSALMSGRFGSRTGVITHGGTAANPFSEGSQRGIHDSFGETCWMKRFRDLGLKTVAVSPFAERHSAWWWTAGFNEIYNTGRTGMESAHEISPVALDWIDHNAQDDNWVLYVNFWDPHTPYRTPADFENPFKDDPLPDWYSEEIRQRHWQGCGPHCAREVTDLTEKPNWFSTEEYPLQPLQINNMEAARKMFDGYDMGVRYADMHVQMLIDRLEELGVLDDTVIIVTGDHGENLAELNVYGDHQNADHCTARVPMIIRFPGQTDEQAGQVFNSLYYQFDLAASILAMAGGRTPENWDGQSFAEQILAGHDTGREFLVITQAAWTCQRAVRWGDYIYIRTYHDGYHNYPDHMLFNIAEDPHEQQDLSSERPELIAIAQSYFDRWENYCTLTRPGDYDPMDVVLREGGPFYTRTDFDAYMQRLESTGRVELSQTLKEKHRVS